MLRVLAGFNHCVKDQVNTWFSSSGYKISQLAAAAAKGVIVDVYGGLTSPLGAAQADACRWILNLSEFTTSDAERLILSMTVRMRSPGCAGVLYSLASADDASDMVDLLMFEELESVAESRSFYIECTINLLTGVVKVYLDTVEVKTIILVESLRLNLKSGKLVLVGTSAVAGSAGVCATGDIYLLDNLGYDSFSVRRGKRLIAQLGIKQATAEDWVTPEGKTVLQTLQAPASAAEVDVITSPLALTFKPVVVALTPVAFPDHAGIDLVAFRFSAKASTVAKTVKTRITQRSIETGEMSHLLKTSMSHGILAGYMVNSADGGAWDTGRLEDTTFTLFD